MHFTCDVFRNIPFVMFWFVEWSSHRPPSEGSIDLFSFLKRHRAEGRRETLSATLLFEQWVEVLLTTKTQPVNLFSICNLHLISFLLSHISFHGDKLEVLSEVLFNLRIRCSWGESKVFILTFFFISANEMWGILTKCPTNLQPHLVRSLLSQPEP